MIIKLCLITKDQYVMDTSGELMHNREPLSIEVNVVD